LQDAAEILDCSNRDSCRSGCPDCILTRDVEMHSDHIDRRGGLEILRTRVLPRLQISEADRKLGSGTTMELEPLEDAIAERVGRSSQAVATIWLPADVWDLDVAQWPAVPLARRLSLHGVGVRFCLPGIDVQMEQDKRMRLLSLLQTTGADLVIAERLTIDKPFRPLAHLSGEHGVLWATREEAPGEAADTPWRPAGNILRRAAIDGPNVRMIPLSALALSSDPSLVQVDIGSEIDGSLKGFGERLWAHINSKTSIVADLARTETIQAIEYTDRYLKSPLTVRLIHEILRSAPGLSQSTTMRLRTLGGARSMNGGYPSRLFHDWARDADRQRVTRSLMEQISQTSSVKFAQRTDLSHARVLSLAYAKSTVKIYLEQGVGFWRMNASEPFDFTRDAATQTQKLLQSTCAVSGDGHKPMPIWLRRN
jgi:DEAD/DEAH box helicase domain-containing protein